MAKILFWAYLGAVLCLGGCKSNPVKDPKFHQIEQNGSQQQSPGFNQESYIWENWLFPSSK